MQNDSILTNLTRITHGAEKLNAQADALTKQVTVLSEHLQKLQIGATVFYTKEKYDSRTQSLKGDIVPCSYYLGFGKDDGGKWGICVICKVPKVNKHVEAKDVSEVETLWIRAFESCSRDVRLALAKFVPAVISGIAQAIEYEIASADSSAKQLKGTEQELIIATSKLKK